MLLARALAQEEFGVYVLSLSLITAIIGVQRALISTPYTILRKDYLDRRLEEYTGSATLHQIMLTSMSLGLGLLFFWFGSGTQTPVVLAAAFAVAAAGLLTRDFVRFFLLSSLDVRLSLLAGISINAMQLAVLLGLVMADRLSMLSSFLAIGICSLIPSVIVFLTKARLVWARGAIGADFKRNLKLGKWMLGNTAIAVVSSQAYIWILALLVDKKSVAVLGVTSALANLLGPVLQGVAAFLLPRMVHVGQRQGEQAILKTARRSAVFLGALFLGWLVCGVAFGDYLLESIYSVKYSGHGTLLAILILYSLVSALTVPASTALDALRRSDVSFKSSLVGLALTASVGTILIYEWSVYGAAVAALLANIVNLLLRWRGLVALAPRDAARATPRN